jgi:hypothetical protein
MAIVDPLSRNTVMCGVEVFVFYSMAHGLKFCTWLYVFDFVLQMDESNKFGLSNTKIYVQTNWLVGRDRRAAVFQYEYGLRAKRRFKNW